MRVPGGLLELSAWASGRRSDTSTSPCHHGDRARMCDSHDCSSAEHGNQNEGGHTISFIGRRVDSSAPFMGVLAHPFGVPTVAGHVIRQRSGTNSQTNPQDCFTLYSNTRCDHGSRRARPRTYRLACGPRYVDRYPAAENVVGGTTNSASTALRARYGARREAELSVYQTNSYKLPRLFAIADSTDSARPLSRMRSPNSMLRCSAL